MTVAEMHRALDFLVKNGRGNVRMYCQNLPVVSVTMYDLTVMETSLTTRAQKQIEETQDGSMKVEIDV